MYPNEVFSISMVLKEVNKLRNKDAQLVSECCQACPWSATGDSEFDLCFICSVWAGLGME